MNCLVVLALLVGVAWAQQINVAIDGAASATSVGWGGVPNRVIDGDTNQRYSDKSCYHSNNKGTNKVTVELANIAFGVEYKIDTVRLYNRIDCCSERIDGAIVYVGTEQCGTISYDSSVTVYDVSCDGKVGTSVMVELTGDYLQICELEVLVNEEDMPDLPELVNVAPDGYAVASSVGWGGLASRVIDGNIGPLWNSKSCYHSANGGNNEITVQLAGFETSAKYSVQSVVIYNRADSCCDQRINQATVYVDDHQCGQIQFVEGKSKYIMVCDGVEGSSVSLKQSGQYINICEIEVLIENGTQPEIPKLVNVAANGTASATSVGHGGVAKRLNDGNYGPYWSSGGCYHSKNAGANQVSIGLPGWEASVKYPINTINVYNRADTCCDQRINQATIYVDDTQCGQLIFKEGVERYSFDCNGALGSIVTLKHQGQAINICEIEVLVLEEDIPTIPVITNVALNRPASQSSTSHGGDASRAVDGNANKWYSGGSCTHTSKTTGNSWEVELAQEEYVQNVIIHNRIDCCSDRINGAKVWIGTGDDWEMCGTVNNDGTTIIIIPCEKSGEKIKITNDNNILTLCEVNVITVEEESPSEAVDE